MKDLKPCPFCGTQPRRYISHDILNVECPNCVSVGFHNHVRLGCLADEEWNTREATGSEKTPCNNCQGKGCPVCCD